MGLLACAALVAACGGNQTSGTDGGGAAPEKALRAAAIADAIAQAPDRADAILAEHDLTAETFRDLMEEISSDPALSKAYEAARKVPDPG